jgi:hypothetical protein
MKQILTYRDLLALEDLLRDHLAELRHRAAEFGHPVEHLAEEAEATLERLREALQSYPDE